MCCANQTHRRQFTKFHIESPGSGRHVRPPHVFVAIEGGDTVEARTSSGPNTQTGVEGLSARTVLVRVSIARLCFCAHWLRFRCRYAGSDRHLSNTEASIVSLMFSRSWVADDGTGSAPISR